MDNLFAEFLSNLKLASAGASLQSIQEVAARLPVQFPKDYIDVMLISNGFSGMVGKNSYLVVWPIEQIERFNKEIGMERYAPGLIAFGDNGSESWYAFDRRSPCPLIVDVPMIGSGLEDVVQCGETFATFLSYLYNY